MAFKVCPVDRHHDHMLMVHNFISTSTFSLLVSITRTGNYLLLFFFHSCADTRSGDVLAIAMHTFVLVCCNYTLSCLMIIRAAFATPYESTAAVLSNVAHTLATVTLYKSRLRAELLYMVLASSNSYIFFHCSL